ncbi:polyketide cyclase/dehydrase/lipid transport protein [Nocardioides albertanoniae]|uniref:Polyketide cyclase/dehydrase/lipid transport protein n=1 Tax=Nocardioides albertanoniae TaxID=1175486 RepID=A0A543A1H1_9ACTN|nr:SRPBCC family protein [Nocardioides albertanoniae]TQL66346.1 polyketide cyclase/dehydrase/lipid transport protein [Nocardioides albertanoniae]
MTTTTDLEATTTINAAPAQVWAAITDLPRMASWSPQVVKTVVLGQVKEGTRFLNINHQGWKHWPTTAKVVRFTPHSDFAFRVTENTTVWSYQLEDTAEGTVVTHRREAPTGISALSRSLTKVAFGGEETFTDEMRAGMAVTLAKLKSDLEK